MISRILDSEWAAMTPLLLTVFVILAALTVAFW
jgi:hypothetical protein